jgi:hypothetical protein
VIVAEVAVSRQLADSDRFTQAGAKISPFEGEDFVRPRPPIACQADAHASGPGSGQGEGNERVAQ